MTEQIERADLARVYRAIGNSDGPMPIDIDVWPNHSGGGQISLRFADGDTAAVEEWAKATGGKPVHGPTLGGRWHAYGTEDVYGGREGRWLGWRIKVSCHIPLPSPRDRSGKAVLGTGDEPADEAIVPGKTFDLTVERAARLRELDAYLAEQDPALQLDVGEIRRLIAEGPDDPERSAS